MKTNKIERLKASGWKTGNAEEFLQLSDEEAQLVALQALADQRGKKIAHQTKAFSD